MNKYFNKKVIVDGMKFDSKAEAKRWRELFWLQNGGVIRNLQRQVRYELVPRQCDENGKILERSLDYIADFVYTDEHGNEVVEDVKGYKNGAAYALFTAKRKLMLWIYGIQVQEVSK